MPITNKNKASSPGPRLCPRVTRKGQFQLPKLNTRKLLNALVWKITPKTEN